MPTPPFSFAPPPLVSATVAVEPVRNALLSLALLHRTAQQPGLDSWVTRTAAALDGTILRRNQLIFDLLGEVLLPRLLPDAFPGYLALLEQEPAEAFRDRLPAGLTEPGTTSAELLTDEAGFAAMIAARYHNEPPPAELVAEALALLNDPLALKQTITGHLRMLWEQFLAVEWERRRPVLEGLVRWLGSRSLPPMPALETARAYLGREVPGAIGALLSGVRHIIIVLSPHAELHATRFGSTDTLWIFLPGRRERLEQLPLRRAPIKPVELVGPFSALADETRLQILATLARDGELMAQEIIARLPLSQSSISRHLKQLCATGFVNERRREGANKSYSLNPRRADTLAAALAQLLSGEQEELPDARADQEPTLRRFLDAEGRLANWPARRKDQLLALGYLIERFERGRDYSESEVNELIRRWATCLDHATLRRELYDERLLNREGNGSRYWRE